MQGGVGAFTRAMARAMADLGHEVRVLTSVKAAGGDEPGVPVDAIIDRWRYGALRAAEGWARAHNLDAVNLQYQTAAYNMSPFIHFLPRTLRRVAPVFTTFHDLRVPYLFPKAGMLRFFLVLAMARGSTGTIVTNHEDESILAVDPRVKRLRRIAIGSNVRAAVPPGYDRAAWRAQIGAGPGDLVVGYFGFLNMSKGAHVLVGAAAKARAAGVPIRLLMVGGRAGDSDPTNLEYGKTVDGLIAHLGMEDRIHWTGFVDDAAVSGHLLACDLCALPYRDGVSYRRGTFMAAIAHGCAVVTTMPDVDIPELMSGQNVRLVPRRDADALAEAIIELADKPDVRARLGRGARELAALFTWDKLAAETLAFFEEVLERYLPSDPVL
ncbi:MAG: glycosyltransferase [Anaerolineae bacterium]|nr:glycosyltransferase [Anaerolineae bacterium]